MIGEPMLLWVSTLSPHRENHSSTYRPSGFLIHLRRRISRQELVYSRNMLCHRSMPQQLQDFSMYYYPLGVFVQNYRK